MNQQNVHTINRSEDFARGVLINSIADDQSGIRAIMARHNVHLPQNVDAADLHVATIAGMRISQPFRNDVSRYLKAKMVPEINAINKRSANFTGNENWFNATGTRVGSFIDMFNSGSYSNADGQDSTTKKKFADTQFGQALNSDRIGSYLDAGLGLIFSSINRKSQKESEQAAMDYEKLKADSLRAAAEAEAAKKGVNLSPRGWIVPAVIGIALIGLTVTAIVLIKNRNKVK